MGTALGSHFVFHRYKKTKSKKHIPHPGMTQPTYTYQEIKEKLNTLRQSRNEQSISLQSTSNNTS